MRPVTVTKLSSTDAFYVVDLDGAPSAAGSVRCARKILVDGAEALARRLTYAYASLGLQVSGASAGINADGDGRDDAVGAFVAELQPAAADGTLLWSAAKGVSTAELDGLGPQPPANTDALFAAGVVASVVAARGSVDGARVALEEIGHGGPELVAAFEAAGATVVAHGADALATDADILGVGSKNGVIDHDNVAAHAGRTIVPLASLAVTTRASPTVAEPASRSSPTSSSPPARSSEATPRPTRSPSGSARSSRRWSIIPMASSWARANVPRPSCSRGARTSRSADRSDGARSAPPPACRPPLADAHLGRRRDGRW